MTDTPGPEPEGQAPQGPEPEPAPEQRLPVPRPPVEAAPVERFASPPSTRKFELTPERAAQVVRQSANARWVGFLAVIVVVLFVAIYWFYELGGPLGTSQPRLEAEADAQQVTAVERGYNVYEANCARCHGVDGEGGIGPILNSQEKLFSHLNEDYLRNILNVGGRLACGDPNSIMPIWADTGHPPGPLNYRQIDELIAFIRAPSNQTFTVRDPELLDPKRDPVTGEVETFTGWVDPDYVPPPGSTPYPACWKDSFATASQPPGASATPAASVEPGAEVVTVTASGIAFTTAELAVKSGVGFTLRFDNQDSGIPHDVQIKDQAGQVVFKTDITTGPDTSDFPAPALDPGVYPFVCSIHPNMTGTLNAE